MVRESNINKEEFEKFLHWLDTDRDAAGQKYELIRDSLIKIFYARGCYDAAEELADETIDRVIKKIDKLAETFEGEPARYCHGVAKNVFLEYLRRPKTAELPPDIMEQIKVDMTENEADIRSLHKCLKKLKPEQRRLIVGYYEGEKGDNIKRRKEIEQEFNITNETLRIRIYRIKKNLQECIRAYSK
jgi:RNA polymerase sigma factor (sigma-70 family)